MHVRDLATVVCLAATLLVTTPALAQLATPPPTRVVVLLEGRLVPVEQFWAALPDACATLHYHAAIGGVVVALDGTEIPDPAPATCGFGATLAYHTVFVTDLPDADFDGLPDSVDPFPNDPDGMQPGTPDGSTDFDLDGLSFDQEFWLSRTDPGRRDSNGNGIDDRTEFLLERGSREFARIPLIANLYQGSGADPEHVREAVEQANRILRQARIGFELVAVREDVSAGDDGSGGGTAGDGRFTSEEGRKVSLAGVNEVAGLPGNHGFKASFAASGGGVLVGRTTPGLSWHRRGSVICEQRASTRLSGATLAHELFHVLTLDHPTPGSPEATPGNLMTPSNAGRDDFVNSPDPDKGIGNVSLTPGQLAQVFTDGVVPQLGKGGIWRSPAVKKQYETALAVDALGDHGGGPGRLDLVELQASTDEDTKHIRFLLSLGGRLPASGDYGVFYRLLIDRDANSGTGTTLAGVPGIDVEVQLLVRHTDAGGFELAARRPALSGELRQLLAPAPLIHPMLVRADDADLPDQVFEDVIELFVDKAVLGLAAAEVPMVLVAQASEFAAASDTLAFLFDRERWLKDPTLVLSYQFASRGAAQPFAVAGLMPGAAYELRFDDTVLDSGQLDGSGAASGIFTVPGGVADGLHFITVRDGSTEFAFGAVQVQEGVFADGFE
jgi:hypothetical protein